MLGAAGDPSMSDPRPGTGDAKAVDVAQLLRDLAVRERQLRDLTEQSLGFLEELAESRRLNGEREQLVARLADLERSLADAKTRLRHAGGAATAPAAGTGKGAKAKARPAFEVVVWGIAPRDAAQAAKTAGVPVVWVGVPDALVAGESLDGVATVVHRDARTPAQCWNLGMASTTADAVLFVGPGARAETVPKLPDTLPANAAILCPRLVRGDAASVGAEQVDDVMRLRARQIADADLANSEPFFRVQHADANAFVVRRAAFERIGTFDEGLLGPAALLEYGLRARRANFDVLGVPALVVIASTDHGVAIDADDRENLLVVAMHRPEQLGRALASTALPWDLPSAEMPGFLAQLFARLPAADDLAQQRGIVERLASGLAQHALPATHVVDRLQRARITLLERFADAGTVGNRDDFVAAARRVADERLTDPTTGFDAFASEIAFCAEAAAATGRQLEATRNELRSIDAERHAHSDRAERADGARQLAEKQLDQVQQWLLEARREIAELQKAAVTNAAAMAEAQHAKAELEALHAEAARGSAGAAAELRELQERFAALQASQREMEQLHEAEIHRHWELERAHLVLRAEHRDLQREHIDTDADARQIREQIARVKEAIGLPTSATAEALDERLAAVGVHWKRLAVVLENTGAGDADELANRLAESERLVRDRERWIAMLLQEVMQRRWVPRQLQDHERALVERVGRSS